MAMVEKSLEGITPQEKEPLFNMNNFYFYLPGGYYRGFRLKTATFQTRVRIMEAIDTLLIGEFSSLDAQKIYDTIHTCEKAMADALNSRRYETSQQLEQALGPKIQAGREAREKLRPLFHRLVEMGFDQRFLAE